jgi:hypothetical protein
MTTVDSSISLALELGILLVKELELKSIQDELAKTKKTLVDKVRIVIETAAENENLIKQVESGMQALRYTKSLLWDHMLKEVKKLKDYLLML